ncbi:hypothetical protein NPIL_591261 [Nephila pilipes]|uniref:Uncharacterized protein n=1 Tax=Nephila pilipes TaxID=299642 RepID=A0A8X6QPZ0_NEPPI|nr:hypothetical protein NPIL_591261 [Nephila pilipes]
MHWTTPLAFCWDNNPCSELDLQSVMSRRSTFCKSPVAVIINDCYRLQGALNLVARLPKHLGYQEVSYSPRAAFVRDTDRLRDIP